MAFTFEEWKKGYNDDRPIEPYCTCENPEKWADIASYAEDKLKEAFDAGYQSCCEEYGRHFLKDGNKGKKEPFPKIDMSTLNTTPSGQVIKDKSSNKTSIIEQTHQQKQCCICGKPLTLDTSAGGEHIKDGFCIPLYFCSNECFFTSIFTPSRIHITSNA